MLCRYAMNEVEHLLDAFKCELHEMWMAIYEFCKLRNYTGLWKLPMSMLQGRLCRILSGFEVSYIIGLIYISP